MFLLKTVMLDKNSYPDSVSNSDYSIYSFDDL